LIACVISEKFTALRIGLRGLMASVSNHKLGYIFVIAGVSLYAFSDAIMKYFMPMYGVNQIMFLRTISRFVPLLLIAFYKRENPLKTKRIAENIFRSILASLGTYLFMTAYMHTSMIDVVVVGYSVAIFVIPLSIIILKEKFYAMDAIPICLGFLGILLAFRPGTGIFQFGTMFALIGAIVAALNQVIIKRLSSTESELTIIFYHHILLMLISTTIGFGTFSPLPFSHFVILSIGGTIGAAAQYCMTHAFRLSTSSGLASATYTMLIPVTFIDFFVYNKVPDLFIIGGLTLIVVGSYLGIKKRQLN
jgi:drug/metabolite transporter (DMT)-like permease